MKHREQYQPYIARAGRVHAHAMAYSPAADATAPSRGYASKLNGAGAVRNTNTCGGLPGSRIDA